MGLATGSGWGSQPEAGLSGHGLVPAGSHSCLITSEEWFRASFSPSAGGPSTVGREGGGTGSGVRPGHNKGLARIPSTGPASYRARE